MTEVDWKPYDVFPEIADTSVFDSWLVAVELVIGVSHLRIRAEGRWEPVPGLLAPCGPDGHSGLQLARVIEDCAVGALIGRLGGGSAGYSATADAASGQKPFAVGTYCLVTLPSKFAGPLFIAFNTPLRPIRVERLKLAVDAASLTL
jgi:hypothetical protein